MSHLPEASLTRDVTSTSSVPTAHAPAPSLQPASPPQKILAEKLKDIRSPLAFKYRLDLRWPAQDVGTAVLEARMTGDFVLMTKKAYSATYVTNRREIEHQVNADANHALGKLVNDNRFIFDPDLVTGRTVAAWASRNRCQSKR